MGFKLGELNVEVEGIPDIYQRVKLLLTTEKGSLTGDPRYGVNIAQFIPYAQDNAPRIMSDIVNAIGLYIPEIRVSKIEVRDSTVTVTIEDIGAIVI